MGMTPQEMQSMAQRGAAALRAGNAQAAKAAFKAITDAGDAPGGVWLGLALAHEQMGEDDAKLAALDKTLSLEPRNLRALLCKADHFARKGDVPAASSFYAAAMKVAPPVEKLPPDLVAGLRRAEAACAEYDKAYETHLLRHLPNLDQATPRFRRSIDMMLGRQQPYFQEPTIFFFPELPQIQFYERAQFPWIDAVESRTAEIKEELERVLANEDAFSPYVERDADRPAFDPHGMIGNRGWTSYYLIRDGAVDEDAKRLCPKTLEAVSAAPLTDMPGRTPSVLFSRLKPGARIPPHHGMVNTRLICHLPLIVPPQCGLRVGGETRSWNEGELLIFDDSIEHEAWNGSDCERVILLFDIWRPELSEAEQRHVQALFAAVDAYHVSANQGGA